ncbi:MAG TPA: FAD-dependent oxidoreductase [Roseomonas sp.]|jgi:NADPH-dependent 2,4-dienoyl-CoA reductase/sulfur reductase-like enzyme
MSEVNVILGAGQAGAHAALALRQAGFAGRILLVGAEPHRPYDRPPLSKAMLGDVAEPAPAFYHAEAAYAENGVELHLGARAEAIDLAGQRLRMAAGGTLPFDRLLLATGGRARPLAVPGGAHAHGLRDLDDARRLRVALRAAKRVVCIGAGIIGLEVASSARALGLGVTVIEAGAAPMARCLPQAAIGIVEALHRAAGVDFHFGAAVEAIMPHGAGFRVLCRDGLELEADCVVAAIGMERNTELAADAGLAIDGGIAVDAYGRASVPNVFAAGDVAAFWHPLFQRRLRLEAWRHAQDHAIATARSMAGDATPYAEIPWFWSDQHGASLQVTGLPGDGVAAVLRQGGGRACAVFELAADGRVVSAFGLDMPREVRAAGALIRAGVPVPPEMLADPMVAPQRLAQLARR